jgi:hypothetical protein
VREALTKYRQGAANVGAGPSPVEKHLSRLCEPHESQRITTELTSYRQLAHSLQRQVQAYRIMRIWRTVHVAIASVAIVVICFHATMELLSITF